MDIPKGATITNAAISVVAADSTTIPLNLDIFGVAQDNPSPFSSTNSPRNSPTTSSKIDWNLNYVWGWTHHDFAPKVNNIVQELVNRQGWTSGNSIAFVIKNDGSTSYRRFIEFSTENKVNAELVVSYQLVGVSKPGDINDDGSVNSADLAILISTWGSSSDLRADINADGRITSADLARIISLWGS